jgi:hypothetical protein
VEVVALALAARTSAAAALLSRGTREVREAFMVRFSFFEALSVAR